LSAWRLQRDTPIMERAAHDENACRTCSQVHERRLSRAT
jgi:hypothetical protein